MSDKRAKTPEANAFGDRIGDKNFLDALRLTRAGEVFLGGSGSITISERTATLIQESLPPAMHLSPSADR